MADAAARQQLQDTLGLCRATLSESGATLAKLGDEAPPAGCLVPIIYTPDCMFESIANLARLGPNDVLLDLGCADGRVVAGVTKLAGCRGVGVDIRPECIAAATARNAYGCEFHTADFRELLAGLEPPPSGLAGVDVCYAHLLPTTFAVLDEALLAAVHRGLRLVTFCSHPAGPAWDACQTGADCFGMVRLYERHDDELLRGRLPGGVGAVRRAAASPDGVT